MEKVSQLSLPIDFDSVLIMKHKCSAFTYLNINKGSTKVYG